MKSARTVVVALLLGTSAWQLSSATWIHVKASVAQHLLRGAWRASVDDGAVHRPWPWADTWPVAKLSAPSQAVNLIVLAGFSGQALAFGPGLRVTPSGAVVLSGHRDTHFRFLRETALGQRLELERAGGTRETYRVRSISVHDYRDPTALIGVDHGSLVLVTCWPFDALTPNGPLRLVVRAEPEPPPKRRVVDATRVQL